MANEKATMVKMVLDRWQANVEQTDSLISELTDDQLQREVAPNKNRGIYLLGHLIAVHDKMLALITDAVPLYPNLYEAFLEKPDKTINDIPSVSSLRGYWKKMNETMEKYFNSFTSEEWFQKHNAVSTEDFIKEPHRNKLNIIITRTTHLCYHRGQLILLK